VIAKGRFPPPCWIEVTQRWDTFHICERNYDKTLPEWKKLPLCRNGGIMYKYWTIFEIGDDPIDVQGCCETCKRVALSRVTRMADRFT